jgi:hypothetical protein
MKAKEAFFFFFSGLGCGSGVEYKYETLSLILKNTKKGGKRPEE